MVDLQFVGFALMPGPVRKEKQFGLPDYVCKIDVTLLSRMSHPASGFPVVFRELKQRRRRRLEKKYLFVPWSKIRERLDLLSTLMALKTCSSLICNDRVQFHMEMRKISRRRSRSAEGTELGHFTLLFRTGRQRNVQKVTTHVHSFFCSCGGSKTQVTGHCFTDTVTTLSPFLMLTLGLSATL